jgi:hypothetical protein
MTALDRTRRHDSLPGRGPRLTRARFRLLAAGLAALALAWVLAPPGPRPPLYDGVGMPDEPYRYVHAPAGSPPTKPPTDAVDTEAIDGSPPDLEPMSEEFGPQVLASIPGTSLLPPAGGTDVTARFQPLAPVAPLPTDGTIVGNVYRFTLTSPQGAVGLRPTSDHSLYLDLRAPTGNDPIPVVEVYLQGTWHRIPTTRDGNDIFGSDLVGVGDYALVRLTHPNASNGNDQSGSPSGGKNVDPAVLIIAGLLLLVVLAVLAIRYNRRPSRRRDGS